MQSTVQSRHSQSTRLKNIQHLLSAYLLLIITGLLWSQTTVALDPIYEGGSPRAAIRGYDTVAYFTENKPVKGSKEYSTSYKGATWHFSSQENLELFLTDPEKYAPQYGGYCAYAVARNTTASIKPKYFTIYDGKLYLNYNKGVQKRWLKDKGGYIEKANDNWPELLKE